MASTRIKKPTSASSAAVSTDAAPSTTPPGAASPTTPPRPASSTRQDIPVGVTLESYERLRAICVRAVECLKGHSGGNEHIEVQANALLEELKNLP